MLRLSQSLHIDKDFSTTSSSCLYTKKHYKKEHHVRSHTATIRISSIEDQLYTCKPHFLRCTHQASAFCSNADTPIVRYPNAQHASITNNANVSVSRPISASCHSQKQGSELTDHQSIFALLQQGSITDHLLPDCTGCKHTRPDQARQSVRTCRLLSPHYIKVLSKQTISMTLFLAGQTSAFLLPALYNTDS